MDVGDDRHEDVEPLVALPADAELGINIISFASAMTTAQAAERFLPRLKGLIAEVEGTVNGACAPAKPPASPPAPAADRPVLH